MPPKKSKKKASKAKNDDLDGMQIALPEDKIKYLEAQTKALELQLAYRSESTATALAECETIREDLRDTAQKHENEKKLSEEVKRSMTRQYKGMQEDLLNKVNERERIIETMKDELETMKVAHGEQLAQKDAIIQQKDADAETHRLETETMCKHFANLLAVTRLKITNYAAGSADGAMTEQRGAATKGSDNLC